MARLEPVNPILVEVWRGDSVESRHRGAALVCDAGGRPLAAWGDVDALVLPRSAVKPLQALPLAASGAIARYGLAPAEIAVACGSHGGEAGQVRTVARWLARLGQDPQALVCGPHPPASEAARQRLLADGEVPGRLHNNCSGKHAGFITLALHLGVPVAGYGEVEHPVQQQVIATLASYAGVARQRLRPAVDGCGVPTFALPLRALALAFARLGTADGPAPFDRAGGAILEAMAICPENIAGRGRFDTELIAASGGRIIVKGGAEGVAAAALPAARLGIAVKIDDGGKRAAEAAMAALLARFGEAAAPVLPLLARWHSPPLVNSQGRVVGRIETGAIRG